MQDVATNRSSSVYSENRSKAIGYLASLNASVNVFRISFMMDVLSLLDILNKAFQKSDSHLPTSLSILKSVNENVLSMKKMNLAHPGKEREQFQIGLKIFY